MPNQDRKAVASSRWSRRDVLSAGAAAGVGSLTGGLAGCSGESNGSSNDRVKKQIDHPPDSLKKKGFPIVKGPLTLQFMTGRYPENAQDFNKVANWRKYQNMTNIFIHWGPVAWDSREEKRNLALSGDDYPEVFNIMEFSNSDVGKYGRQGQFINLDSLIDKYMPNLKKIMGANDEVRRGVTFPDGGIYGMPNITDPNFLGMIIPQKPFVRGDSLDRFDMDVPSTTEEFYRYLKAVKTKTPRGKGAAIPYCEEYEGNALRNALMGSFGVGTRGVTQAYLDADPKDGDKLRFYRISDGYKALLEYLHRLYNEGLIAKNVFSIDRAKFINAAANGTYGSMLTQTPEYAYNAKHFIPMPALKGPDGDRAYNAVNSSLSLLGGFVITDKCNQPLAAARCMDHFYSDEGARLFFMGVEGKSYKKTNGGVEWVDKIRNPKKGVTQNEAKNPYVTYMGSGYAGIFKEDNFRGAENEEQSKKAAKLLKPDAPKTVWPAFTFTQDEAEQLDSLADDIEKYVDESTDKFIEGSLSLSSWDKYVTKIKNMGLDDYLELQQKAYDRYRKDR